MRARVGEQPDVDYTPRAWIPRHRLPRLAESLCDGEGDGNGHDDCDSCHGDSGGSDSDSDSDSDRR